MDRFRALESTVNIKSSSHQTFLMMGKQHNLTFRKVKAHHVKVENSRCKACEDKHEINKNKKCSSIDNKNKISFLKKHRYCFNCLKRGHLFEN